MSNRLRMGWKAKGEGGYHGYAFRHQAAAATLSIWAQTNAGADKQTDVEPLEAEVVFLIRRAGQWPLFQTEIHFHPSEDVHRRLALRVMSEFGHDS